MILTIYATHAMKVLKDCKFAAFTNIVILFDIMLLNNSNI